MKTIDYTMDYLNTYTMPDFFTQYDANNQFLFFDIETTGFIANHTTLYLIGVLWYANQQLYIRQWFNDDGISEKELITEFLTFSKDFTHLVHFNGLGFDLPYLKQKASLLSIPFSLDQTMKQVDIYKEIKPYKNIFPLDNLKQVSIENFLDIPRDDTFNGKELIRHYQLYLAKPNDQTQNILLLHNHDDLLGMTQISHILHYKYFFEKIDILSYDMQLENDHLNIRFKINDANSLPKRITISKNKHYLNAIDNQCTLLISIYNGTLKHFFKDYKNYYYLPLEDMAIHKSVATYVDNNNKEKATKQTCYIKKTDLFIPCYDNTVSEHFQQNINDSSMYQTVESILTADSTSQINYIKNTLQAFL